MDTISKKTLYPVIIILFSILTEMASTDILLPTLPFLKNYYQTTASLISLIISVNLLGLATSGIIYGWLSDYYGRRPLFLIGNIIFFFGSVFCIFAPNIYTLIAARFLQGLGGGVCATLGLAILRDLFDEEQYVKILSVVGIILTSSPAIFPLLGGFLVSHFFWQINYYLIGLSSLVVATTIYLYLPESNTSKNQDKLTAYSLFKNYTDVLSNSYFLCNALICSLTYAATWVYLAIMPLYIVNVLHYPPTVYGLLIAINVAINALGTAIFNKLVGKYSANTLLLSGIVLLVISSVLFIPMALIENNIVGIIAAESLYWAGVSPVFSNASEMALSRVEDLRGIGSSTLISFEMIGGSLAVYVGTYFYNNTMLSVAVITLCCVVLVCLAYLKAHAGQLPGRKSTPSCSKC